MGELGRPALKSKRIEFSVSEPLLSVLEKLSRRSGGKGVRLSATARKVLEGALLTSDTGSDALRDILLAEASSQEDRASSEGGDVRRRVLLRSAALEIEALAMSESPTERAVLTTLIQTVRLLKDATGYKSLPDVPGERLKTCRKTRSRDT